MYGQVSGSPTAVGDRLVEAVLQQPVLLIAVAVAAAVVLAVGGYLWLRLATPAGERFVAAVGELEEVAVLMHPNPDPDAMASAMAVVTLAESVDTDATIQYPGEIRRPENRAFEVVLECAFERIVTDIDLAADEVVLVDHNEPRGFIGADGIDPYAVVDHHPGDGEGRAFTDVRPDHGSCSSILAEYLADEGYGTAGDRPLPSRLATGLLYGIQSDTTSFTRGCASAEFDAASYLFPAANANELDRIANPEIDDDTLEVKSRAIRRRRVDGPFLVSHVGSIDTRDALSAAADELVRLEGITAVVVTGEADGELHASGRSQDDRVHMGKTLEVAFDGLPGASFGGHSRMGGGRIPLPDAGRTEPPRLAADGGPTGLHARLFAAMNGEL